MSVLYPASPACPWIPEPAFMLTVRLYGCAPVVTLAPGQLDASFKVTLDVGVTTVQVTCVIRLPKAADEARARMLRIFTNTSSRPCFIANPDGAPPQKHNWSSVFY